MAQIVYTLIILVLIAISFGSCYMWLQSFRYTHYWRGYFEAQKKYRAELESYKLKVYNLEREVHDLQQTNRD